MSNGKTLTFHLPAGWTLRKVATAMVQEWLPPFRAEPAAKAARWVIQSVMEARNKDEAPLWEPGISTQEYEERLDSADLNWAIRATAGRGKATVLARLVRSEEPESFELICPPVPLPETILDAGKLSELVGEPEEAGTTGIFTALLRNHGFQPLA